MGARDRERAAQDLPARPGQDPALAVPGHDRAGDLGLPPDPLRDQRPDLHRRDRRRASTRTGSSSRGRSAPSAAGSPTRLFPPDQRQHVLDQVKRRHHRPPGPEPAARAHLPPRRQAAPPQLLPRQEDPATTASATAPRQRSGSSTSRNPRSQHDQLKLSGIGVLSWAFALSPGARSFACALLACFWESGLFFPLYGIFAYVLPVVVVMKRFLLASSSTGAFSLPAATRRDVTRPWRTRHDQDEKGLTGHCLQRGPGSWVWRRALTAIMRPGGPAASRRWRTRWRRTGTSRRSRARAGGCGRSGGR